MLKENQFVLRNNLGNYSCYMCTQLVNSSEARYQQSTNRLMKKTFIILKNPCIHIIF
jgi:hypothetical protein